MSFGLLEAPGFRDASRGDGGGSFFERHYDSRLEGDIGLQTMEAPPWSYSVDTTNATGPPVYSAAAETTADVANQPDVSAALPRGLIALGLVAVIIWASVK